MQRFSDLPARNYLRYFRAALCEVYYHRMPCLTSSRRRRTGHDRLECELFFVLSTSVAVWGGWRNHQIRHVILTL